MDYTHLAREERYQIAALLKAGCSQSQIAGLLKRHPSTICREIARNAQAGRYCGRRAEELARVRSRACANAPRIEAAAWELCTQGLLEGWSPEEAAGRMRLAGWSISHETIYQHVYAEKSRGGTLWCHLRCQKPRRKRYGHYDRRGRGRPPGAISIEMRPPIVETRTTFGHWEGDTMLDSGMKSALVTLVERKARYTLLAKVRRKTAPLVRRAIKRLLKPFKGLAETLTLDNGKEFSDHQKIAESLQISCYFAQPYASWQRGTVENTNGLLRQYFPRKRPIATIRQSELRRAMDKLNHRPRKCLGFLTPHEVMSQAFQTVALQG